MWSFIKSWGGKALGIFGGGGFSWGLVLVAVLACVGSYFYGRHDGSVTATAKGEAKYSRLETAQARAELLVNKTALDTLAEEVTRRDKAETSLLAARKTIAEQGDKITNRRIEDASRSVVAVDGRCTFGPDWVRLWNESLGFGDGDPGRAPAAPGAAGAARPGQ